MTKTMHFSTFLKFLTLPTGDKIRHISAYQNSGGFDFYRSSRDAIGGYTSQENSPDDLIIQIKSSAPSNAVARNLEIFENVLTWFEKQKISQRLSPQRCVWKSPGKRFAVLIEPEIAFQSGNSTKVVAVYPRHQVRLNRDIAGAGIMLLRHAYGAKSQEEFGILDAYAQRAFWSPTNVSSAILEREIDTIDSEFAKLFG